MSETTTKVPFDPIPVGGSVTPSSIALADPPRPSFSRSAPDVPTGGLLPPSRKPLAGGPAPAAPLPVGIAPETPPAEPNPAPGTPPPNPTAVRGLFLDLFRLSRAKGAIAAGLVSLFAGAYGLNLVMPTPAPPDSGKANDPAKETAKGPQPSVTLEKQTPQVIENRLGGVMLAQNQEPVAPAPLPPFGGSGGAGGSSGSGMTIPIAPVAVPPASPPARSPEPLPLPLPLPSPSGDGLGGPGQAGRGQPEMRQQDPIPAPAHPFADRAKPPPTPEPVKTDATPLPVRLEPGGVPPPKPDPISPAPKSPFGPSDPAGSAVPVRAAVGDGWNMPGKAEVIGAGGTKPDGRAIPLPALPAADAKQPDLPARGGLPTTGGLPAPGDLPTPTPGGPPAPGAIERPKNRFEETKKDVAPLPVPVAVELPNTIQLDEKKAEAPLPPRGGSGGSGEAIRTGASLPTAPAPAESPAVKLLPPPSSEGTFRGALETGRKPENLAPAPPLPAPAAGTTVPAIPAVLPTGGAGTAPLAPPPAAPATPPKTDFDVDVIRVRASDTYSSISEQVYGTKQYAAALKTFNGGADLGQLREVMAPPMHVIRTQSAARDRDEPRRDDRGVLPAGGVRGPVLDAPVQTDSAESVDWGAPGRRRASVRYEKYTTPREGMTAREVAKAVYDDEREWGKLIGPRGARLRADDPLPRGTEVTVPREELPWK
jgi:hypothetical protein